MSMRQKTRHKRWQQVTANASETGLLGADSVDAFRGVFHHLTVNGEALTRDVLGSLSVGTAMVPVSSQDTGGFNTFGCATDGGVYGGDCLAVGCTSIPVSTDYLTHDRRFNAVAHALAENTVCYIHAHPNGGALPSGITGQGDGYDSTNASIAVNVLTDSFELSDQKSCTPSDSGGDLLFTSNAHGYAVGNTVRFRSFTQLDGVTLLGDYYVISDSLTANTFKISDTPGGGAKPYIDHYGSGIVFRADQGMTFTDNGVGQCIVSTTGKPSFYLIQSVSDGDGTITIPGGNDKFFGPVVGRPYNRLEFWIKYPEGYRQWAAANSLSNTFNIGTYHATDALSGFESFNYHFYYQIIFRTDLSAGNWIRCVVGETPQHQRNMNNLDPGSNPTPLVGNFFDCLTRFYLKDVANASHPDYYSNYDVLVDRLRIYYEDPPHQISLTFDSLDTSVFQGFAPSVVTDIPFTITNTGGSNVSGNIRQVYSSAMVPQIFDSGMSVVEPTDVVVVPASGTWTGYLRFTPLMGTRTSYDSGSVTFLPLDQITLNGANRSPSHSDANCEPAYAAIEVDLGPLDAWRYAASMAYRRAYRIAFDDVNDKITFTDGYSVIENQALILKRQSSGDSLPSAFTEFQTYYAKNVGTAECQLAATSGDAAITFDDSWSTASGFFLAY